MLLIHGYDCNQVTNSAVTRTSKKKSGFPRLKYSFLAAQLEIRKHETKEKINKKWMPWSHLDVHKKNITLKSDSYTLRLMAAKSSTRHHRWYRGQQRKASFDANLAATTSSKSHFVAVVLEVLARLSTGRHKEVTKPRKTKLDGRWQLRLCRHRKPATHLQTTACPFFDVFTVIVDATVQVGAGRGGPVSAGTQGWKAPAVERMRLGVTHTGKANSVAAIVTVRRCYCYELRLHERIATHLGPFYNNNSKFKY